MSATVSHLPIPPQTRWACPEPQAATAGLSHRQGHGRLSDCHAGPLLVHWQRLTVNASETLFEMKGIKSQVLVRETGDVQRCCYVDRPWINSSSQARELAGGKINTEFPAPRWRIRESSVHSFHFANVPFKSEEESDVSIKLNYSKKQKTTTTTKKPKSYPRSNVRGFQGLETVSA